MEDRKRRTAFGHRLWESRTKATLTQHQAAAALGISQGTLAQAESRGEGSALVVHMARLYKVDPWWLASGEGSPEVIGSAYSESALELARHYDAQPDSTQEQRSLKARLYWALRTLLPTSTQDLPQTPAPASSPRPAREPQK